MSIRELIAEAQRAELSGEPEEAARHLRRAAELCREGGSAARADQLERHARRLLPATESAPTLDRPPAERGRESGRGLRRARPSALEPTPRGPELADFTAEAWCSFCCRPKAEVGRLVAGPAGAFICQSCSAAAVGLLAPAAAPANGRAAPRADPEATRNTVTWHQLGRVEYPDGLTLQRQILEARRASLVKDTLLLLEHSPVLTMGRGAKAEHVVAAPAALEAVGVRVFETDRGGDVTYHGPGQIVGYPILHLGPGQQDVRRYVRNLEEVVIRTLGDFGVEAGRQERWPGVWVERSRQGGLRKICALGVHLSRWFTSHGFALNVSPNLEHFSLIVPCGIREAGVTSVEAELARPVPLAQVEERLVAHFGEVFDSSMTQGPAIPETVAVAVVREGRVLATKRSSERGGFWQIVTGHVEAGETPAHAAARELEEETGLALQVAPLDYVHVFPWGEPRRDSAGAPLHAPRMGREHGFVAFAPMGAQPRLSDEHVELDWLDLESALQRFPAEGLRETARRAMRVRAPGRP